MRFESDMREAEPQSRPKVRVLKPPAVRRGELIDCAQRLFLERGYERTTINDVIAATGLSKGAFYHYFASKEDLLEAIAQRFAGQSLGFVDTLQAEPGRGALASLNLMLAVGREWKLEHMRELRAMFTTLLKPENAVLYQRIVAAVFAVLTPALAAIIERGRGEGVFAAGDPRVSAEVLLQLANGRRPVIIDALAKAETDPDAALAMVVGRVRAEEGVIDRILGLPAGSVRLIGSVEELAAMLRAWSEPDHENGAEAV
jgi:AcrR family transcriptional regulator